ncbi:MAG TPA: bifunctional oligoribonuclease/PAP phosphatase NrnA [Vicinamibacterales bacterium]|nr:bifunctional oligoribonuclease/PAP phosphatase NrnA [Vicinamibacterales bacterium]
MSTGRNAAREAILARKRFLITSHARPDGDSIGSQMAMAYALDHLGKHVRIVNADPAPAHYCTFPGMERIEIAPSVEGEYDGLIVMECGDLKRPGVEGLDGYFTINIDHHVGNSGYGDVNWYDETAAACSEMVFELVEALGVPISREIATHTYLAILTDTGSFHHSSMTARTFEISRKCVEAGMDPAAMARQIFDSNSVGKLKLIGTILERMQLEAGGRVAVLRLDDALLESTGATMADTEGLINMPLGAEEVQAVVMFKTDDGGRVSLRSKSEIDVRSVALKYGGGGHRNAAGLALEHPGPDAERKLIAEVVEAVENSELRTPNSEL